MKYDNLDLQLWNLPYNRILLKKCQGEIKTANVIVDYGKNFSPVTFAESPNYSALLRKLSRITLHMVQAGASEEFVREHFEEVKLLAESVQDDQEALSERLSHFHPPREKLPSIYSTYDETLLLYEKLIVSLLQLGVKESDLDESFYGTFTLDNIVKS